MISSRTRPADSRFVRRLTAHAARLATMHTLARLKRRHTRGQHWRDARYLWPLFTKD